jgi:hypothetical protein
MRMLDVRISVRDLAEKSTLLTWAICLSLMRIEMNLCISHTTLINVLSIIVLSGRI